MSAAAKAQTQKTTGQEDCSSSARYFQVPGECHVCERKISNFLTGAESCQSLSRCWSSKSMGEAFQRRPKALKAWCNGIPRASSASRLNCFPPLLGGCGTAIGSAAVSCSSTKKHTWHQLNRNQIRFRFWNKQHIQGKNPSPYKLSPHSAATLGLAQKWTRFAVPRHKWCSRRIGIRRGRHPLPCDSELTPNQALDSLGLSYFPVLQADLQTVHVTLILFRHWSCAAAA